MKLFRDLSIKRKLVVVIVITTAVSLFFSSGAVVLYDAESYKAQMVDELAAHADIIAHNSAAALTFDDRDSAAETLQALHATENVMTAYVLDPSGNVFARYIRDATTLVAGLPLLDGEGHQFFTDRLAMRRPVVLQGDRLGSVYIEGDLTGLGERVRTYAGMTVAVACCALILALLMSSRFQRLFSSPILKLAETAKVISRQKNYGLRAVKSSEDEVGTLIDGFNEMLEQIQARDAKLERHRGELEREVALRTSELRDVNVRLKESEARIRAIVEGTSSTTGRAFFEALSMTLGRALGMRWVMVGRLVEPGILEAQALWDGVSVVRGNRVAIEGTPCGVVVRESFAVYEDGVADLFPREAMLTDWRVRSYVGVVLRNSAGAPIGTLCAFHDQTLPEPARDGSLLRVFASRASAELERMMVEEELLRSESRTRAILDSAADGIITIGDRGTVETFNVAAEEIFGYQADEVIGTSIAMLMKFPGDDPRNSEFVERPDALVADFCGKRSEIEGVRSDASVFPMNLVVSHMQGGATESYTAIVRDITHERELDAMKSDFVSTVSHEIRTPLSCIISSAKILQKNGAEKPDVSAKFSGIIADEGKRLSRLINDLLNLSKMDTGGLEWTFRETEVSDLLRQSVTLHLSDAREYDIELSAPELDDLGAVKVDRDKFIQVMSNLIRNSAKFTSAGGSIELRAEPWKDGFVCVSVTDTGIGIAPEHHDLVFERFKQIGDVLTDRPQGTGLGLTICRDLVEYWGGRIWVESEAGKGTTFRFTVPGSGAPEKAEERDRSPRSVLVVDDEHTTREMIGYLLEKNGYEVFGAVDGEEALEVARRERPSLITLDIMMPGMSGYDVLEELRADEELRDTPVLLMSVLRGHDHTNRGLELGASAYLNKPVDESNLIATAERLVGGNGRFVLIVHSDTKESDAIREKLLPQGYTVLLAPDVETGRTLVASAPPDLVILGPAGMGGPGAAGNDFVSHLKSDEATADIPVLMLTEFRLDGLNAAYLETSVGGPTPAEDTRAGEILGSVIRSLSDDVAGSAKPTRPSTRDADRGSAT